jgi:hypothetical protein
VSWILLQFESRFWQQFFAIRPFKFVGKQASSKVSPSSLAGITDPRTAR